MFANPDGQWTHLVLQETGSDCMAKIRHSPGETQKQTRSLGPTEVTVVWRETRPLTWASTWKDEDEESADSPDDTDDFTDIWDKDGDEQRDRDPQDGQDATAATLEGRRHHAVTLPPPTQQRILDDGPENRRWIISSNVTVQTSASSAGSAILTCPAARWWGRWWWWRFRRAVGRSASGRRHPCTTSGCRASLLFQTSGTHKPLQQENDCVLIHGLQSIMWSMWVRPMVLKLFNAWTQRQRLRSGF